MVEQIDNPANRNMHYGDRPVVGVIGAPDRLPKKTLYSPQEADKVYNELQYDLYQSEKHTKPPKKGSFPLVLKIIFGAGALAFGIAFRKDLSKFLKKIFKNPFKKTSP